MVPTPRPFGAAFSGWRPGSFLDRLYPARPGRFVPRQEVVVQQQEQEQQEQLPASLPPITQTTLDRPLEDWEVEQQKQLEADLAAHPPAGPSKVGTITNYENYTCEVWYYPDSSSYGVVCPFDHERDSGAIYRDSNQAKIYAESTLGMTSR